ncbi:hypothetical protein GGI12_000604 [Dipsacomyces acuminosporus]|nr:hypothetical protein GGI12_000604 [Dipsacomyces acuminosporus]
MAGQHVEGKLEVHVFEGRNLPNRNRFGKQDSAVELSIGTAKKRTQVDKKGGATPRWNDRLYFTISGLGKSQLLVKALEIDSPTRTEDIGSCVVDLARIFEEEEVDGTYKLCSYGWYQLKNKERPAGSVYIEFTFTPKNGRKKLSKAGAGEDDDLDTILPVAPKTGIKTESLASAPSTLPPGPHRPNSLALGDSGSNTVPTSSMSSTGLRPSLSDLRPYSSASMYTPELATQYANKHGKKPLPVTPPVCGPGASTIGPGAAGSLAAPVAVAPQAPASKQPMQGYDMTLMPGQFPPAQQQQQPVFVSGPPQIPQQALPPIPQQTNIQMQQYPYAASPQQFQPQQQQQQPPLMNLFAPPAGEQPAGKLLPQPPASVPAFNPAYNPAFANDQAKSTNPLAQTPAKVLPVPPASNIGAGQIQGGTVGYSAAPQQSLSGGFIIPGSVAPMAAAAAIPIQQQQQPMFAYNPQMSGVQPQMMYGTISSISQPMMVTPIQQAPHIQLQQPQQHIVYADYPLQIQQQQQFIPNQPPGFQPEMALEPTAPPMITYESLNTNQQYQQQPPQMFTPGNFNHNHTY